MLNKIFINAHQADEKGVKLLIAAFNDTGFIINNGGYLFKCCVHDNCFHFGCTPWWVEGERQYHYNLPMRYSDEYALMGSFLTDGKVNLLFKPQSANLSSENKERYSSTYIHLAAFLISNGFSRNREFDDLSIAMLKSAQLFMPVPSNFNEIVQSNPL